MPTTSNQTTALEQADSPTKFSDWNQRIKEPQGSEVQAQKYARGLHRQHNEQGHETSKLRADLEQEVQNSLPRRIANLSRTHEEQMFCYQSEIRKLRADLEQEPSKALVTNVQVRELESENKQLRSETERLANAVMEAKLESVIAKDIGDRTKGELATIRKTVGDLTAELATNRGTVNSLMAALETNQEAVEVLKAELSEVKRHPAKYFWHHSLRSTSK